MGTNPMQHWNKSTLTLEPIQLHIVTNPISHYTKSNFTCEKIPFHIFILIFIFIFIFILIFIFIFISIFIFIFIFIFILIFNFILYLNLNYGCRNTYYRITGIQVKEDGTILDYKVTIYLSNVNLILVCLF